MVTENTIKLNQRFRSKGEAAHEYVVTVIDNSYKRNLVYMKRQSDNETVKVEMARMIEMVESGNLVAI